MAPIFRICTKLTYPVFLAVVIMGPLFLAADGTIFSPLRDKASYEAVVKAQPSVKGQADLRLLSHRLIRYDEQKGFVTHEVAALARGNTLSFFRTVDEQCDRNTITGFMACANKILGSQFYYRSSDAVADAWANRYSDCDLNSYLLMDAMRSAGFTARIVYSPGHAFISFTDEFGNIHFQETTEDNNKGKNADLTDPFYRKTLPGFYYQPQDEAYAERIYPILTAGRLSEKDGRQLSSDMLDVLPDNPLVQDVFFHFRMPLTDADAVQLKSLLVTDISSSTKRMMLTRYYLRAKKNEMAAGYMEQIDDALCNNSCLELKADIDLEYKTFLFIKKYFSKDATILMIKQMFAYVIVLYFSLILALLVLQVMYWWLARLKGKEE